MRLGILGGTFDPVHVGHTALAEAAAERLSLDRVLFIPNARPPHKPGRQITPYQHRVNMLRIALENCRVGELCEMETGDDGPNYTIDTVRALKRAYDGAEFFLIMGSDEARDFSGWRSPEEIMEEVTVVVALRAGWSGNSGPLPVSISVELPDVSATGIRERAARGADLGEDVHPGVAEYLTRNRLYSSRA